MRSDTARPSGRFLLRIDPALHAALRRAAREAGVSLNDYCSRSLAAPAGRAGAAGPVAEVVRRAAALFGEQLAGVLLYGSVARGEAEASSDVDVLVVVDPRVRLTRSLYRRWDEEPVAWEGRTIDPHFAHPPDPAAPPSGLWAELALDGIVLFECGLALSRALVRIRREILAGRLERRVVHGQPYWAAAS
jgi:predicted nucleotidyltransferase